MKSADFYLQAIPEPVTLLGLRLRPFSLGHVLLLHRVESAFVTGATPDFNDLALSVFICSQKYADALAAFDDKSLPRFMRKWHDKLSGKSWFRKPKLIPFAEKCEAFAEYLKAGSKVPNYTYSPEDVADMECPSVQLVKVTLQSKMHFTEAEILDRPWGWCLWDFVTLRAIEGKVKMVSSETINDGLETAKALYERYVKKGANGAT